MPNRAPLTAARLAQIADEHRSPVVLELLWEIHRLRSTTLRADQIRRMLGRTGRMPCRVQSGRASSTNWTRSRVLPTRRHRDDKR